MTSATPGATGTPPQRCPLCGGTLIGGRLAIPIVGSLRFVYRLGTHEVATEVAGRMCTDCGHVQLTARDPAMISRAVRAALQSRPSRRWALRSQQPPRAFRSRYGQEQAP